MSRKTFYQQFHNKEEVFADAYDQALGELLDMMRDAAETSQGRRDRLAVRVTALLTRLVSLAPDMVETVLSPIWAEAGWQ